MDHSENEQSTIGHEVQAESPDMGIDVDGGGSGCLKKRRAKPYGGERERVENILIESTLWGLLQSACLMDDCATFGLLAGHHLPDSRTPLLTNFYSLGRCFDHMMAKRVLIPDLHFKESIQRIKGDQVTVQGYYFCDPHEGSETSISHGSVLKLLRENSDCQDPVILRVSLANSDRPVISCEFLKINATFASCDLEKDPIPLTPLPFRVIDRAYLNLKCLRESLLRKQTLLTELKTLGKKSFEYDSLMNSLIQNRRDLIIYERFRMAQRKAYLKWLIRDRLNGLLQILQERHQLTNQNVSSEQLQNQNNKNEQHLFQLLAKDLPTALLDVQRRLPIQDNISFHERPIVTLKAPRSMMKVEPSSVLSPLLPVQPNKRIKASKTTNAPMQSVSKGALRPILPIGHLHVSRPLTPIPAAEGSDNAEENEGVLVNPQNISTEFDSSFDASVKSRL